LVTAGQTAQGAPYLLIGIPGEDVGTATDAGSVIYVQDGRSRVVDQGQPGVADAVEAGDRFGQAVAGDANHIAIGVPGEAIGSLDDSGMIHVLEHTWNADGMPHPVAALHQDTGNVTSIAEAGDKFGDALALTGYRPAGAAAASHSLLAVGVPGEGLTVEGVHAAEAGEVITFHFAPSGSWSQEGVFSQLGVDISGSPQPGNHFGAQVAVTNTAPTEPGTAAGMLLAVGVPDETVDGATGSGAVQTFSLLGNPADSDHWIVPGNGAGLPGTPGAGERLGSALTATGTRLYVGMPHGPSAYGAVHTLPWSNLTGGTVQPVTTYEPGQGGLPAGGGAFGTAIQ
jgi:hypothetical protein